MERTNQRNPHSGHSSHGRRFYGRSRRGGRTTDRNSCFEIGQPAPILELPDDVLYLIFQYLRPKELCKLSMVCERFRQLASDDCVWWPHERGRILLRSRNSRTFGRAKDRYRVSLNWENGHRHEAWLLKYSHRLLPWLQREENVLWVSRGHLILKLDIKDNGHVREHGGGPLCGLNADVTRFVVNNGIVVSGYRGGGVSTWEAASGMQLLNCTDAHDSDTQCVGVIDGAIVSGSRDKTVKVLSMCPDDTERVKKCFNIEDRVWSLSVSPIRSTVAVGTACYNNPAIVLLDVARGQLLGHLGEEQKRGSGVLDMKFECPNTLLTCGHDTYLRLWDLRTHTCVRKWEDMFDSAVYCLQSDGQNTMLTGTARHGVVRLWDKRHTQHIQAYYCGDHNSPVYSLVGSTHHLYLALDLGLNLVDFSIR